MSLSAPGSQASAGSPLANAAAKGSKYQGAGPLAGFLATNHVIGQDDAAAIQQAGVDPLNLSAGFTPKPAAAPALPVTPVVEAPPVMPLADDKAIQMQQRKSMAALVKSRGRASTILTSDGSLGTPPQALGSG